MVWLDSLDKASGLPARGQPVPAYRSPKNDKIAITTTTSPMM
jgi:hypothetical protein